MGIGILMNNTMYGTMNFIEIYVVDNAVKQLI